MRMELLIDRPTSRSVSTVLSTARYQRDESLLLELLRRKTGADLTTDNSIDETDHVRLMATQIIIMSAAAQSVMDETVATMNRLCDQLLERETLSTDDLTALGYGAQANMFIAEARSETIRWSIKARGYFEEALFIDACAADSAFALFRQEINTSKAAGRDMNRAERYLRIFESDPIYTAELGEWLPRFRKLSEGRTPKDV
jgi:hypothetical protein